MWTGNYIVIEFETTGKRKTLRLNSDFNYPNLLKLLAGSQSLTKSEMHCPEASERELLKVKTARCP